MSGTYQIVCKLLTHLSMKFILGYHFTGIERHDTRQNLATPNLTQQIFGNQQPMIHAQNILSGLFV